MRKQKADDAKEKAVVTSVQSERYTALRQASAAKAEADHAYKVVKAEQAIDERESGVIASTRSERDSASALAKAGEREVTLYRTACGVLMMVVVIMLLIASYL